MKRHMLATATAVVLGMSSVMAANPFSDVIPQDWAYQAVAQLAEQGGVEGYPEGTFKGEQKITRFEMAQMVGKAISLQKHIDTDQMVIIHRLSKEFAPELRNLGVAVSVSEEKVGQLPFSGDESEYEGDCATCP